MAPDDGHGHSSIGPPDRQTLRLLERTLADEPVVSATEFEPDSYTPQLLRAMLDGNRYPSEIAAARLEIRWFESDDFSIHYSETSDAAPRWECRWDHHPNPHSDRLHFHEPPNCETVAALSLPSLHPLDVVSTVLAAVDKRLSNVWETE